MTAYSGLAELADQPMMTAYSGWQMPMLGSCEKSAFSLQLVFEGHVAFVILQSWKHCRVPG
jgi:hypothetical protein